MRRNVFQEKKEAFIKKAEEKWDRKCQNKIFLLATGKSVYWFAVSNALDYMVIAIGLLFVYRRMGGARLRFSTETAKNLLKKSRYYIIPDMMVAIFAQTDRIMLKLMIDDAATGYYSAAVACAGMTAFVFSAVIDSFRPMIFDDKKNNEEQYEKDVCRLYSIIIYLSLLQSVFITAFAGLIIRILYGVSQRVAADRMVYHIFLCRIGAEHLDSCGEQTEVSVGHQPDGSGGECGAQLFSDSRNGDYGCGACLADYADFYECDYRIYHQADPLQ